MVELLGYRVTLYGAIAIGVSLMVASVIMPVALQLMSNQTLTSVNAAVISMWHILVPLVAVVAVILVFLGKGWIGR